MVDFRQVEAMIQEQIPDAVIYIHSPIYVEMYPRK